MAKKTRTEKEQIVATLKEKLDKAKSFVVSDYHGLSVGQMQELKKLLREVDAEFNVVKNTLLTRASKETGKSLSEQLLEGPTAILFSFSDPIEPVRKLAEFIKNYQLPKIKLGFMEGKELSKEEVISLSKLPGRQELYTKIVGGLNYPIYGLVSVLTGNLRNLVYTLEQIRQQKGGAS